MILSPIISKVLAGALAGSLILSGILGLLLSNARTDLSSAKEVIRSLEGWQGQMVTAIGLASGNSEVTKDTAQAQVQALGTIRIELKNAVARQNAQIEELSAKTAEAQRRAEQERRYRVKAVERANVVRFEFEELAKTSVPQDQVEIRIREMQDQLYEAGL